MVQCATCKLVLTERIWDAHRIAYRDATRHAIVRRTREKVMEAKLPDD